MAFEIVMLLMVVIVIAFTLTGGAFFGGVVGLELLSTLIFVGGICLVIASKDPLLISLLMLLLVKRVGYKAPIDSDYDHHSVRFDLLHQ